MYMNGKFCTFVNRIIDKLMGISDDDSYTHEMEITQEMNFGLYGFQPDRKNLPKNYKQYHFTPENMESTDDFYSIAKRVMEKILTSYYTVTNVYPTELRDFFGKKLVKKEKCYYTEQYYELLRAQGLAKNIYLYDKDRLLLSSQGLHEPITEVSIGEGFCCHYIVYAYKCQPVIKSVNDAKKYTETVSYDICFEYEKNPDSILIVFNTNTVDINDILSVVKGVCEEFNKELRLDMT